MEGEREIWETTKNWSNFTFAAHVTANWAPFWRSAEDDTLSALPCSHSPFPCSLSHSLSKWCCSRVARWLEIWYVHCSQVFVVPFRLIVMGIWQRTQHSMRLWFNRVSLANTDQDRPPHSCIKLQSLSLIKASPGRALTESLRPNSRYRMSRICMRICLLQARDLLAVCALPCVHLCRVNSPANFALCTTGVSQRRHCMKGE